LRAIRPTAFIVENVSGMQRSDFLYLLQCQVIRFRMAGYCVVAKLLNAADYGVPQERKRFFIVGIRSEFNIRYSFPEPTHDPKTAKPYGTIRQAIGDLPEWPEGEFFDDKFHWYYLSRNRRRDWDG
jgi:DNA (cytosine-5)-methyltransferase 1